MGFGSLVLFLLSLGSLEPGAPNSSGIWASAVLRLSWIPSNATSAYLQWRFLCQPMVHPWGWLLFKPVGVPPPKQGWRVQEAKGGALERSVSEHVCGVTRHKGTPGVFEALSFEHSWIQELQKGMGCMKSRAQVKVLILMSFSVEKHIKRSAQKKQNGRLRSAWSDLNLLSFTETLDFSKGTDCE